MRRRFQSGVRWKEKREPTSGFSADTDHTEAIDMAKKAIQDGEYWDVEFLTVDARRN